jgi:23S rRNA (guanosine2251-2'-O)-methyltransferase
VLEALARAGRGGASVERVLLADEPGALGWWRDRAAEAARSVGAVVARGPRTALDRIAGGAAHQGVAARLAARRFEALDDVLAGEQPPSLLVLVDGVEDPRNLGAIIRTAAAAGAAAVLVPERRCAAVGPACAKAAAGALERVRLARVKNVHRALEALREAGVWTVGLEVGARTPWTEADLRRPTCLVVGGEEAGLSRLARERCDTLVGLPMSSGVESLNASAAAAIVLFEAVRQRRGASGAPATVPE